MASIRCVGGWSLGSMLIVLCGLPGCGSDSKPAPPPAVNAGAGGDDNPGGGETNAAGTTSAGGSGGSSGDCPASAAPEDGAVVSAQSPAGSRFVDDVRSACDGSFAVSGRAAEITFTREDGTEITLTDTSLWLARFDAQGNALWASGVSKGLDSGDPIHPFVAPAADSVLMSGAFGTSALFGEGEENETTLTTGSAQLAGFVASYAAADGRLQWVRQVGPAADVYMPGIAAAPDGTAYVIAQTSSTASITIAPGELDFEVEAAGIVSYAPDGSTQSAVRLSDLNLDSAQLAVLATGDVLLAATASQGTIIAGGTPQEEVLPAPGGLFLARFSADLELLSLQLPGVPSDGRRGAILPDGSTVFAGSYTADVTLDVGGPNETTFTNDDDGTESFVARLDANGQLLWATALAGTTVSAYAVSAQADGSTWVAGAYTGSDSAPATLEIGPGTPAAVSLDSEDSAEFVARLTPEGAPVWAVQFQSDMLISLQGLTASPATAISVGDFSGTATFGSAEHELTSTGAGSSFIVVHGP